MIIKSRCETPQKLTLTQLHSRIAKGLDLGIQAVEQALPDSRYEEAEDIAKRLDTLHLQAAPGTMNYFGMIFGAAGFAGIMAASGQSSGSALTISVMAATLSAGLAGVSAKNASRDIRAEKNAIRLSVIRQIFSEKAKDSNLEVDSIAYKNKVPWREPLESERSEDLHL